VHGIADNGALAITISHTAGCCNCHFVTVIVLVILVASFFSLSSSFFIVSIVSPENHLLAWLKKAKVFVESDSLGTEHLVTIRYCTKLDPTLTHLANFHEHLINQLMMINIDIDTATALAPYLKQAQLDTMSNGDNYVPILPNFEVYKTRLSYGHAPTQIMTEVIGIKGEPKDAKLLMHLASETSNDPHNGVYLPKGAVHLLGPSTYEQVLKENIFSSTMWQQSL